MIMRIRAGVRLLAQHPEQGRVVPEYGDPAIRELIVAPYRVVYRYSADRNVVQVVAVYHSAQLLPASLHSLLLTSAGGAKHRSAAVVYLGA